MAWIKIPLSIQAQPVLPSIIPSYQILHNIAQHSSAQEATCPVLEAACHGQPESIDSPAKT